MKLRRVVFPDPEGPMMAVAVPALNSPETFLMIFLLYLTFKSVKKNWFYQMKNEILLLI